MFIEQVINLRKVNAATLKFRTDLRSSRLSHKWLVNKTVDDYIQLQIGQKIFELLEAHPTDAAVMHILHFFAFYLQLFWLQIFVAVVIFYRFRFMPDMVFKNLHAAIWSGFAVCFESFLG